MNLVIASLSVGLALLVLGVLVFLNRPGWQRFAATWPRSMTAALLLMGSGAGWFLWKIAHLGEADFGDYRYLLFTLFLAVTVSSFFTLRDFLAVRGLAVLLLLLGQVLLQSAYMHYDKPQRLLLVIATYVGIVTALYLGALPYRMRDFSNWLIAHPRRFRSCGALLGGYGIALTMVAFTF